MLFVIILLVFLIFLSLGIYLIVKSKNKSSNKGFYLSGGIVLIILALYFIMTGSYFFISGEPYSGH